MGLRKLNGSVFGVDCLQSHALRYVTHVNLVSSGTAVGRIVRTTMVAGVTRAGTFTTQHRGHLGHAAGSYVPVSHLTRKL